MKLILASASPRRVELIKKLQGFEIIVRPSECSERTDKIIPAEVVKDISMQKAADVAAFYPEDLVLGADTIVSVDGIILGKPHTPEKTREYLKMICGRSHSVYTGVTFIKGKNSLSFYEESIVSLKPYDEIIIENYIRTGKPLDKAGAYGVQDPEFEDMVESYSGELDNIIGLPVERIRKELKEWL